jgi:hypothetical protein
MDLDSFLEMAEIIEQQRAALAEIRRDKP